MEENILQEGQIVEVDYDKDLVKEYQNNYIMEEEGRGADPDLELEPYGTQTTINEVPFEEMNEEGEVIVEEVTTDDKNN